MISKVETLLRETRKVPSSGKQRCIRLSSELDDSLSEIAEIAQSILGYNVSVSHISRMILERYQGEVHDLFLSRQEAIKRKAFPIAAPEDGTMQDAADEDADLPDTLPEEEDADEESEEEYVRRMLSSTAIDTSSWEP
jgi:hypothetical protein